MIVTNLEELIAPGSIFLPERVSILVAPQPLIVALGEAPEPAMVSAAAGSLGHLPTPVVLVGDPHLIPAPLVAAADVCLTNLSDPPRPWVNATPDDLVGTVSSEPEASLALVGVLRGVTNLSIVDAIAFESASYALLLASRGFKGWLERRGPPNIKPHFGPVVSLERIGHRLIVSLNRPEARNAFNNAMRDGLVEALGIALSDPELQVELRGVGSCFSAGGDLQEFGEVDDPGIAHAVRLTRHPGRTLAALAERSTCFLNGQCVGAGIEIPAFACTVVADPAATFRLPELGMGLIPGAGGTVSISHRIGRQRTAWLALSGGTLTAQTALSWGLVDRLDDVNPQALRGS
jgi:enoyl-CoA hydratase/carnithine racemase